LKQNLESAFGKMRFSFFFQQLFSQDQAKEIVMVVSVERGNVLELRCMEKCKYKPNYFSSL
jgi:hypothetical protein